MPKTVLGIDYGQKRIGLAVGQTFTASANPLKVIGNNKDTLNQLQQVIDEWQIDLIVMGLPLTMDGEEQLITRQVKNFAKKLRHLTQLPVAFSDERLSSYEAERGFQQQRQQQTRKAKHKNNLDAEAAAIILQSWFNQQL
ncbi:Holliday junction resolvase RuvX [Marinicella gelatinilytica]|uniref:Holliday junction resolvase RuvX n=1 Tax=Marinicella gelatinilytica TaxID=2996017 RepID=UPI002260F7D6|nr:Holliday junction resolvase RuvX [Marinicella gelatinilytica]MCX7544253.1 Holliday junction resolvase RuvX [Marinicella gelatinilytica]